MNEKLASAEARLYSKLGMENPNKPRYVASTTKTLKCAPKHTATITIAVRAPATKVPPPVQAKPVRNDAAKGSAKAPEFESGMPPPPGQEAPSSAEAELDALTDLLMQNLENTGDPEFFGICHKCKKKISGDGSGCTAMGNTYHVDCFICKLCQGRLSGKEFYNINEEPHCETCYMGTLEECVVCAQKITERILRAVGVSFHPACFNCTNCHKNLDNIPFTLDAADQVHCIDCYHQKFSPRCAACNLLIMPQNENGEVVHIVSMQKNFHVECYKCEDCEKLLTSDDGHGCYPLDGHLLCQTCNGRRVQQLSATVGRPEPTTEL